MFVAIAYSLHELVSKRLISDTFTLGIIVHILTIVTCGGKLLVLWFEILYYVMVPCQLYCKIRAGVWRTIQRQIFFFLNENICCDSSLEQSRLNGSNDGSQSMFSWRNMANYP